MFPYAPWLCWFIPILGTAVTTLFGAVRRKFSSYLAKFSIGMGALFSFSMISDIIAGDVSDLRTPWLCSQLGVLVDPLSVLMACVITCIGFLVTVFSVAYMREEPSLARFWFLIQLFIGGYVVIVMADNLLFMFVGWEIVGVCCTGLAAFWYKDPKKTHIGFPIMDESKQIVGIVTLQDAMKVAKEKRSSIPVGEIATKDVVVVFPENSVAEAFEEMSKHNIGRLLVVDKKDSRLLLGILTRSDVMHALSTA